LKLEQRKAERSQKSKRTERRREAAEQRGKRRRDLKSQNREMF
jgi:hypothetical protein